MTRYSCVCDTDAEDAPCTAAPDAEDLLCAVCRKGCVVVSLTIDGRAQRWAHVEYRNLSAALAQLAEP